MNGSSTGGTVAIRAAAEDPRIQAMVLRVPRSFGVLQYAPAVKAPTLVVQGSEDKIVLPEAMEIYEALRCEKELCLIKGAGHLFDEKPRFLKQMTDATCAWFEEGLRKVSDS